jgi:hypothetical protein
MVQLSPPTLTQLDWANTGEAKVKRAVRLAIAVKFLIIGRSFSCTFRSVDELKQAINRFIADTNGNPKPFVWTADPRRVLAAVKRGKQALESVH